MKIHRILIVLGVGVVGAAALGYQAGFLPASPGPVKARIDSIAAGVKHAAIGTSSEETNTVYKWKDASGRLHYSNTPPKKGEQVTEMQISSQQNVVQSRTAEPLAPTTQSESETKESTLSGLLENYNKPVEKAVDARNKMEQHNRQLEKAAQ